MGVLGQVGCDFISSKPLARTREKISGQIRNDVTILWPPLKHEEGGLLIGFLIRVLIIGGFLNQVLIDYQPTVHVQDDERLNRTSSLQ